MTLYRVLEMLIVTDLCSEEITYSTWTFIAVFTRPCLQTSFFFTSIPITFFVIISHLCPGLINGLFPLHFPNTNFPTLYPVCLTHPIGGPQNFWRQVVDMAQRLQFINTNVWLDKIVKLVCVMQQVLNSHKSGNLTRAKFTTWRHMSM